MVTPDISYKENLYIQGKSAFTSTKYQWAYDNRIYTIPSNWRPKELSNQKSKSRFKNRHRQHHDKILQFVQIDTHKRDPFSSQFLFGSLLEHECDQ
jgi:hypothetical protein